MKHEKLLEAMDQISDEYICEAAAPASRKSRKLPWIGAAAAVLALAILVTSLGSPMPAQAKGLLAQPEYPQMAPYPDERSFVDPQTGEFDSNGFSEVYSAWVGSQKAQYNQPEGYADSLQPFFKNSMTTFLSPRNGDNTVYSPANVYMALAMLAEVTGGNSRQQILDLLDAADIDSLRTQAGQVWNANYRDDGASRSLLANSLWLDETIEYKEETVQTLAGSYYASVYRGDLGSAEMNQALQDWLNTQTRGLLEDQSRNVQMDPMTVLSLASTVCYQVKWREEFHEKNNEEMIFHGANADVPATFMKRTLSYGPYYWSEGFGAVGLGLEDGGTMWLILPDPGVSPQELLEDGTALDFALGRHRQWENQAQIKVHLSLPKFDVVSGTDLSQGLKALGVTDIFDESVSDFSPIFSGTATLSTASHAARVAIDEEGITAAAYTVMMAAGAMPPPEEEIDFVLDRPFLFVITNQDDTPLFAGVVNTP